MMVSMCNNLSPLFTKWSLQWSTKLSTCCTRAMPDVIVKQVQFSAPLRGTRITQQCQMRGRSVIRSVVYEPPSLFGLSNRTIGRPAARKRIRRKPPPPQIHPFLGGRKEGEVHTLKHESRILRQWSNSVSGSRKSQASSPRAKLQSQTCSVTENSYTGLDECLRILLSCFRARNSGKKEGRG